MQYVNDSMLLFYATPMRRDNVGLEYLDKGIYKKYAFTSS